EAAGAAIGGEHAVTRHDDRNGIPSERLTNGACRIGLADAFRDLAVRERRSWLDRARHVVDAPMELRYRVVPVERDVGEIARLALEQRDDAVDRVRHERWWSRLDDVREEPEDSDSCLLVRCHRDD